MNIQKEQGLFAVVAVLGLWIWSGMGTAAKGSTRVRIQSMEYQSSPALADPLAAPLDPRQPWMRDAFREPSETSPLEPRSLPFPPRTPLPVVALPLTPGPLPHGTYSQTGPRPMVGYRVGSINCTGCGGRRGYRCLAALVPGLE